MSSTEFNLEFLKKISSETQNRKPGIEENMSPAPVYDHESYRHCDKLKDKVALITGGDSGIGRAVAVAFAKEGADVVIVYLNEHNDANKTKQLVERAGRKCILIDGDITKEDFCKACVKKTMDIFGKVDILVNNAGEHWPQKDIQKLTSEQVEKTFATNVFSMIYFVKACEPYLKEGSAIINTSSITAYKGSAHLLDYSASKGAVVSLTRSLARAFSDRKIRVNGVAPGPIWTPLIPASFTKEEIGQFGSEPEFARPGQPVEVAPAFVFLASADSSYMTGQVLHVNGGYVVNT